MPASIRRLLALSFATLTSGCAPPPELTASQEKLVSECLELAFKQETGPACAQGLTKPMEKAFLAKHPDFYERLVAERKKFVEERIAEDVRRRDALNRCLDEREGGVAQPASCEQFMVHEIARGLEDRKLRRCAAARLDEAASSSEHCAGLSAREIEDEVAMERVRREREP